LPPCRALRWRALPIRPLLTAPLPAPDHPAVPLPEVATSRWSRPAGMAGHRCRSWHFPWLARKRRIRGAGSAAQGTGRQARRAADRAAWRRQHLVLSWRARQASRRVCLHRRTGGRFEGALSVRCPPLRRSWLQPWGVDGLEQRLPSTGLFAVHGAPPVGFREPSPEACSGTPVDLVHVHGKHRRHGAIGGRALRGGLLRWADIRRDWAVWLRGNACPALPSSTFTQAGRTSLLWSACARPGQL